VEVQASAGAQLDQRRSDALPEEKREDGVDGAEIDGRSGWAVDRRVELVVGHQR